MRRQSTKTSIFIAGTVHSYLYIHTRGLAVHNLIFHLSVSIVQPDLSLGWVWNLPRDSLWSGSYPRPCLRRCLTALWQYHAWMIDFGSLDTYYIWCSKWLAGLQIDIAQVGYVRADSDIAEVLDRKLTCEHNRLEPSIEEITNETDAKMNFDWLQQTCQRLESVVLCSDHLQWVKSPFPRSLQSMFSLIYDQPVHPLSNWYLSLP